MARKQLRRKKQAQPRTNHSMPSSSRNSKTGDTSVSFHMPVLDPGISSDLRNSGEKMTFAAFFPAVLDDYTSRRILGVARLVEPSIWAIQQNFHQGRTNRAVTSVHAVDSQFVLSAEGEYVNMFGSYLVLGVPIHNVEQFEEIQKRLYRVVGALRMIFGPHAARPCQLAGIFDLTNGAFQQRTPAIHLEPLPAIELEDIRAALPNDPIHLHLKVRCIELIGIGAQEKNRVARFILFWTALEVQMGDGNARRTFCQETLESKAANDELKRLHSLRSSILHKGQEREFTSRDEYIIMSLIRMSSASNEGQRKLLLEQFESRILKGIAFPEIEKYSAIKTPLVP